MKIQWHEPIDIYCERTAAGLLAEPINLITNLSFIIGAWWCWRALGRRQSNGAASEPDLTALVILLAMVGVGSALFHSVATAWAQAADVLPIVMFILVFLGAFAKRILNAGAGKMILVFALCAVLTGVCAYLLRLPAFNGSELYVGSVISLALMALYTKARRLPSAPYLGWAALSFVVAITARTIDQAVCGSIPIGTHFLWHLGVGLTATLATRGLMAER